MVLTTELAELVTTEPWLAVMTLGTGTPDREPVGPRELGELTPGHSVIIKFFCTEPSGSAATKTDSTRPEASRTNLAAPPSNDAFLQLSRREPAKVVLISPPLTATNGSSSDPC